MLPHFLDKLLPPLFRRALRKRAVRQERKNFALGYVMPSLRHIKTWLTESRERTNFTYDLTDINLFYLAHTVSLVTGVSWKDAAAYIREAREDRELEEHVAKAVASSPFRFEADEKVLWGRRLGWYAFVRARKPAVVVETGVDKGHGSVLLCSALLRNRAEGRPGRYYGTDINPAAGYLLGGKYRETGEILYGDSIESLKKLDARVDLFINDSDHSADYEYREYNTVVSKLAPGAIILGDNSHATDALARFASERGRKFLFFRESPKAHWYPGAGIGISF